MTLVKMATEPWRPHSRELHREKGGGRRSPDHPNCPGHGGFRAPRVGGRSSTEIILKFSVMAAAVISRMRNIVGRSEIHPPAFSYTVRPRSHSDLIPWAQKIEFESCK